MKRTVSGRWLLFLIVTGMALFVFSGVCSVRAQDPASDDYFTDFPTESSEQQVVAASDLTAGDAISRMLVALGIVLALMFGVYWFIRRYAPRGSVSANRHDTIRVLGTKMLGGRQSLMLVRVRGQTLLLGITSQSISCLTEIAEIDGEWVQPPEETPTGDAATPTDSRFGRMIRQIVARDESERPPS
ncbi:flagellar biosynthetic protein FliO [bacterium]|nr:flagellar biosynthetic protein FliO [bacterium]